MPWIERTPTKLFDSRKERKEERGKYYGTAQWRKLRLCYLQTHPLCELCDLEGRVTAGEDVHHIHSPFVEGMKWMYDCRNLITLCKDCHGAIHGGDEEKKSRTLEIFNQR